MNGKKDVVRKHNGILLSHKKECNNAIAATWMDLDIIVLSDISHKEKDKYNKLSLLRGT